MLLTVNEFSSLARRSITNLVKRLQRETGRVGSEEEAAWRESLPRLAHVLDDADLGDFHLHLESRSGDLSLEYRLPAASSWCDVVLLGRGPDRPSAAILELKHWDTRDDRPGPRPGIVMRAGTPTLHPSEQVRGYVEYCRRFHSAVQERGASVEGCSLFTASSGAMAYRQPPHTDLVAEYPVFTTSKAEATSGFTRFIRGILTHADADFAEAFESGTYSQDRSFVHAVADAILRHEEAGFVLLDGQRLGYERCLEALDKLLMQTHKKVVVLIEGPPGSGKSVLAAKLWAALAVDQRMDGNAVLVTTSASQRTNWKAIYDRIGQDVAARGLVKGANEFNPGLTPAWVNEQRRLGQQVSPATWERNLRLYRRLCGESRIRDDQMEVAVVDEAHSLIDPTAPGAQGIPPSGWCHHAGPQAYHLIRSSRLSVFLLDPEQSYRDNETTSSAAIRKYAEDLGAEVVETISLANAQFRCAGSKEYVEWVEALFRPGQDATSHLEWRRVGPTRGFHFDLVPDVAALEGSLRPHVSAGHSARLVASYGREWLTKKASNPHALPQDSKDFRISYVRDGVSRTWSRIWNYTPEQDYTLFVQAPEGSPMYDDPLCEIGCPYVVRGFDWDYVGLLWLSDLVWRGDRWRAQLEHVQESAWKKTLAAAKREQRHSTDGPATAELVSRLVRGYRILLTRAIRGTYVWCEDPETRDHLSKALVPLGGRE